MLAILSDRDAIIQKKEMEYAQAVINDIYPGVTLVVDVPTDVIKPQKGENK